MALGIAVAGEATGMAEDALVVPCKAVGAIDKVIEVVEIIRGLIMVVDQVTSGVRGAS